MADYYKHFKGGKYKLLGIAKDSETQEKMVVYQALYGEGELWVRPYEMFFGTVERDGKVMQRFTKITEEEALGASDDGAGAGRDWTGGGCEGCEGEEWKLYNLA